MVLAAACRSLPEQNDEAVTTLEVNVTAYCLKGKTASGLKVRTGIAAADPDILPIGSIIRLRGTGGRPAPREGVYTILDTGGKIQGRRIDLHIPSCAEAVRFGRRSMVAEVLRHGWTPDPAKAPPPKPERPSGLPWLPWRDGFRLQQPPNDNTGRDSTDDRGRQSGAPRAAGSDSRDAADAASAARR